MKLMISPCYHDPSHGIRFPDVTCDGVQAKKKKKLVRKHSKMTEVSAND